MARSQKTGGTPWSGLAIANAQQMGGNFTGYGVNVLMGADTAISQTFSAGIMVYAGNGSTTPPSGTVIERRELLAGPYFSSVLGNGDALSGYLLYGKPDYQINNGPTTTGESTVGSLTWSRTFDRPGINYSPFAAISFKHERPTPADRVDSTILTVGTSLDGEVVQAGNGFRQVFGRIEMDVGHYNDNFTNDISYVAPRIGGGVRYAFGNGAFLQVQANASAASDKTAIVAAQVSYRFQF
jgi:hypothetical protein